MNRKSFLLAAASVLLLGTSAFAQSPALRDNTPGSFVVAPKFDIRGERATQIRIVNNYTESVNVKLNYVCPGVKHVNEFCAALDRVVTFTPFQTRIINVADQNPPCEQGYVVGYAVQGPTATPIAYNYLTGSYHNYDGRRHEGENLVTIQSDKAHRTVLGSGNPRQLSFDGAGADYRGLGTVLGTDFRATSVEPEAGSRLVLLDLNILAGMQNPPSVVFIDFWNSAEEPFSTSHEFICWTEVGLDEIDLNFFEANLGTTYGSMRINPVATCPIPGTCPPNIPHAPGILGQLDEYGDGTRASRTLFHDNQVGRAFYQPR